MKKNEDGSVDPKEGSPANSDAFADSSIIYNHEK